MKSMTVYRILDEHRSPQSRMHTDSREAWKDVAKKYPVILDALDQSDDVPTRIVISCSKIFSLEKSRVDAYFEG